MKTIKEVEPNRYFRFPKSKDPRWHYVEHIRQYVNSQNQIVRSEYRCRGGKLFVVGDMNMEVEINDRGETKAVHPNYIGGEL